MFNKILRPVERVNFNPSDPKHRKSLKKFLINGSWDKVQFNVEEPYVTVPETVLRKYALHCLKQSV